MVLLFSLFISIAVSLLFSKQIKRHPSLLYIFAFVLIALSIWGFSINLYEKIPHDLYRILMGPILSGGLAVSFFSVVMYLAVFPKQSYIYKKLMPIRRELSMTGCIFSYFHNFAYGLFIFPNYFNHFKDMTKAEIIAATLSIILMIILLPLFITSFKAVQNRMSGTTWKMIQSLAYPFYGLLYLHIIIIFANDYQKHYFNFFIYSVVFGAYALLRLRKANSH